VLFRSLDSEKIKFAADWQEKCIDYKSLKAIIKSQVKPLNLTAILPDDKFACNTRHNLEQLAAPVGELLGKLNDQVDRLVSLYDQHSLQLNTQYQTLLTEKADTPKFISLLKDVLQLERFILLNYTGVTKIMKKLDRHSSLHTGSTFILGLTTRSFFKSDKLSSLKKTLMDISSGSQPSTRTASPKPTDGSNRDLAIPKFTHPDIKQGFPAPASMLPNQKILISMQGPHGTDIIGAVLECLSKHNCPILDFALSRLYHNVSFGCLTRLNPSDISLFADLSAAAVKWDATLNFDSHDSQDPYFKSLEDAPYSDRIKYAATVLNQYGLTSGFMYDWTRLLLDHKISVEKMTRLSGCGDDDGMMISCDFKLSIPGNVDFDELRATLFQLSSKHGTDVALQPDDVFRKSKRLVIFDMDSTLIQQEVIDEIAKHAGVVGEVAKITEQAMNGEIDFKQSLAARVALLKGTPVSVLDDVKGTLTFTEGAHFLCRALKRLGYKLAVISGGFMPLALHVKNHLGLDYAFANQLKVSADGKTLTGETVGPIVDGLRKAELLEVIAQAESVTAEQVIAVGDGANDLWMLAAAGLGIAFNAKPRVQEKARARINQKSLRNVLYLLGYSDADAKQLV